MDIIKKIAEEINVMDWQVEAAVKLIDENTELDAILAATDAQGIGAVRALKDNGYRTPQDIMVLSMAGTV